MWWQKANYSVRNDYDWSKMPITFKDRTEKEAEAIGKGGCFVCGEPHNRKTNDCKYNKRRKSYKTEGNATMTVPEEDTRPVATMEAPPSYGQQLKE
jgi:hypothetical protein